MGRTNAKSIAGFEELLLTTKFDTPINTQTYSDAIKAVLENVIYAGMSWRKINISVPIVFDIPLRRDALRKESNQRQYNTWRYLNDAKTRRYGAFSA